jgi:hypothetical protein
VGKTRAGVVRGPHADTAAHPGAVAGAVSAPASATAGSTLGCVDDTSHAGQPFAGYALRRVVVAPDLDALSGPLQGRWQLPLHLDSSARALYDFGSPLDRAEAYQLVLLEAGSQTDHEQWLDRDELLGLWPELYLPRVVRAAWQNEHSVPARIGAGRRVPQL